MENPSILWDQGVLLMGGGGRSLLGTKDISAGLKETMSALLIFRSKGIGIDFCPVLVSTQL